MVNPLAPADPQITPYDQAHFLTYARLLDADREKADWGIVAATVLEQDVANDLKAARMCYDSHLARAYWVTAAGLTTMNTPDDPATST